MSMKRLAILSSAISQNVHFNSFNVTTTIWSLSSVPTTNATTTMTTSSGSSGGRSYSTIHGNVNVLLGGAMLSGVILVVVCVCYCCHRNINKHPVQTYSNYWREPEVPLEVFTLSNSQSQCYETAGLFLGGEFDSFGQSTCPTTPGLPPPSYETVIAAEKFNDVTVTINATTQFAHNDHKSDAEFLELSSDETGLPSYQAALRLEAHGYV